MRGTRLDPTSTSRSDTARAGASSRRTPRVLALLLACGVVLTLSACDWTALGFAPGNSRYNSTESKITVANVAAVEPAFAGVTGGLVYSSPAIASNVAYVGSSDGYLYAFDARGVTNCNPSLQRCDPLWKANLHNIAPGDPTVANGVVYITTPGGLYAYDAAGTTGCSGTPTTCTPLWQASFGSGGTGDPVVVNGVLYVEKYGTLYAFDAAGSTSCSGSPRICSPLWTAAAGGANVYGTVAVANGVAYVPSGNLGGVYAFDATGTNGCSGSPKTCVPLWKSSKGGYTAAVVDGRLYSQDQYGLYAFDAAGATSCQGIPKTCGPLWTYNISGRFDGVPAIANGVIYVSHSTSGTLALLTAYDATGSSNCGGAPKACNPLWESSTRVYLGAISSPAVANGVVFIGSRDGSLYAFDAAGSSGCSGAPKACNPLWSSPTNGEVNSSPAVANGKVFVGSTDKSLYVFQ